MTQLKPFYYSHVVWDWNGTLLNDVEASLNAVNEILKSQKTMPLTLEQYRNFMEAPIKKFYGKMIDFNKLSFSQAIEIYTHAYNKHAQNCQLSCGTRQALNLLASMGSTQMIVSASEEKKLLLQAAKLEVIQYFQAILGADNALGESKLERAFNYIQQQETEPSDMVVIGDTVHDYEMAKALGCDCVLIAQGHESVQHLLKCDALVFNSMEEFLWYIQDSIREIAG